MRGAAAICVLSFACATGYVQASSVATAEALPAAAIESVRVSGLAAPAGARQLGIVEAKGSAGISIVELIANARASAAAMGANLVCVDAVSTKYERVTQTYTYTCGDSKHPQTCTGVRTVEVATPSLIGHAYRLEAR